MNNQNVAYEEDYKGYHIRILQDDVDESPRDDDNLGTMACWHNRMNLGDVKETNKYTPIDFMRKILYEEQYAEIEKSPEFCSWIRLDENYGDIYDYLLDSTEQQIYALFQKYYVILPIWAYEH